MREKKERKEEVQKKKHKESRVASVWRRDTRGVCVHEFCGDGEIGDVHLIGT